jgi:anti-anti-sigma regulatory factor
MTLELVEREAERQLDAHGPDLVLDLRATTFMDLWGLRMIEALERRASERGGVLVLEVASYAVRRLLELAPPPPSVRVVLEPSTVGTPA